MPAAPSFAEKPTITGERVLLRPVDPADAAGLAAIDAEALRLTGTQSKASMKKLRRWYATRADHADRLDLSIIDRVSGRWAGEVVLNNLDRANRSCGFRILLGSAEFRDRGLGTEASRLALAHAFERVGVHRVELQVYAFNPRASTSTTGSASATRAPGGRRCAGTANGSTHMSWRCWPANGGPAVLLARFEPGPARK